MRIKDALKRDLDIDIKVSGGEGTRADPFVFETPLAASDAVWSQWQLLRGLGKGRRELWRLREVFEAPGEPDIQGLRIDTIAFTEREIISETRSYYFKVAGVQGRPNALVQPTVWADRRAAVVVPFQVGWLHYDEAIENAARPEDLDVSLLFSAEGVNAILYIYGVKDAARSKTYPEAVRAEEFDAACQQVRAMHPNASPMWEQFQLREFVLQYFRVGEALSVVGVTVAGEFVVKLRLTHIADHKMLELMHFSLNELVDFLPHKLPTEEELEEERLERLAWDRHRRRPVRSFANDGRQVRAAPPLRRVWISGGTIGKGGRP